MTKLFYRFPRPLGFYLGVVVMLVAIITGLHYSTMHSQVHLHTLYRELYLVPIILMSVWGGLAAGLGASVVVSLLYAPHVFMTWEAQPGVNFGNLLQILAFLVVASVVGYVSDRERERQHQLAEAEHLAAHGRASLAMSNEMQRVQRSLEDLVEQRECVPEEDIRDVLRRLTERLQVLARTSIGAESGPEAGRPVIELNALMARVRNELNPFAKEQGVTLQIDPLDEGCLIEMSEKEAARVLAEIVRNGIENSHSGSSVKLTARKEAEHCEVEVIDHGRGISSEDIAKIFVPFYTTKPGGNGLGLSVSQKIVKDNNGSIWVSSRPGHGSTFRVLFPQPRARTGEAV